MVEVDQSRGLSVFSTMSQAGDYDIVRSRTRYEVVKYCGNDSNHLLLIFVAFAFLLFAGSCGSLASNIGMMSS